MSNLKHGITVGDLVKQLRQDCIPNVPVAIELNQDDIQAIMDQYRKGTSPFVYLRPVRTGEFWDAQNREHAVKLICRVQED